LWAGNQSLDPDGGDPVTLAKLGLDARPSLFLKQKSRHGFSPHA